MHTHIQEGKGGFTVCVITLRNHLPAIQPKAHSLTITPKVLKKLLDLGRFDRRALINCLQVKNKKSQNGGCFKCKLIQIKRQMSSRKWLKNVPHIKDMIMKNVLKQTKLLI